MAEYIDRKAVLDELERVYNLSDCPAEFYNGYRFAMQIVNSFKKADVAPVRHGRWLNVVETDLYVPDHMLRWEDGEPYEEPTQDVENDRKRLQDLIHEWNTCHFGGAQGATQFLLEHGVTFREG